MNEKAKLRKDFDKILSVNRMQHHYIQNLQKANDELKSQLVNKEEPVTMPASRISES